MIVKATALRAPPGFQLESLPFKRIFAARGATGRRVHVTRRSTLHGYGHFGEPGLLVCAFIMLSFQYVYDGSGCATWVCLRTLSSTDVHLEHRLLASIPSFCCCVSATELSAKHVLRIEGCCLQTRRSQNSLALDALCCKASCQPFDLIWGISTTHSHLHRATHKTKTPVTNHKSVCCSNAAAQQCPGGETFLYRALIAATRRRSEEASTCWWPWVEQCQVAGKEACHCNGGQAHSIQKGACACAAAPT